MNTPETLLKEKKQKGIHETTTSQKKNRQYYIPPKH